MYGYASHGRAAEALSLFRELHAGGRWPHAFDFSIILRVCASLSNCCLGRELHCFCLKSGYLEDVFVANGLVAVYASCGLLRCSEDVFWGIRQPDLASWTSMLSALIKNGFDEKALWLLEEMARDGVQFDAYVLSVGLKASSNLNCRASGVQIHCLMVKLGLNSHAFLRNSLLEFYGRL
ncbi:Pentatricopeptide repeat-containing protein [Apostasia shenzhenica]|uniref:Pentatricopeptide repeat-containing protein n=1 Tax=Apostasia shenzhenica TaxID=1088818 RepID=A0A2I0AA90_9ASPA|nr:Pentatricopeptide repeat-containing protein [Apostasia shenzhenica]